MTQPQTEPRLVHSPATVPAGLQQMQPGLASGELNMNDVVGPPLTAALETAEGKTAALLSKVGTMSVPARLGTNAVSAPMTDEFVSRAAGDRAALAPMLEQDKGNSAQARAAAVDTAIANVRATDGSILTDLATS